MVKRNKMSGLGPKEAELISTIGSSGRRVFSVSEASELMGIPNVQVSKLVHRLVQKKKLLRIEKAKYLLIPPEAWREGKYTEEGIIIASQLVSPYYLSYWTALSFYGWTEQPSRTIFVVTPKIKKPVEIQGITFRFVKLKPERFFGFRDHWVGSQKVSVAEREKAIVDCLDQPRYCGEIVEVAKGLWNGRNDLKQDKLVEYALKMQNGAIVKRLGYLLEALDIGKTKILKKLEKNISPNLATLDPSGDEHTEVTSKRWNLRVNVKPENLTEWRTH